MEGGGWPAKLVSFDKAILKDVVFFLRYTVKYTTSTHIPAVAEMVGVSSIVP